MSASGPVLFEQRYELREQLWLDGPHGGWLATDRLLGREVVVHRPYRPEDDRAFRDAANARARVRHAALVPVYDVGTRNDGGPFFTEPYIRTADLSSVLRDSDVAGATSLARLVGYLMAVSSAVAYLQGRGHAGLELHPGRVLVAPETGEAFLWWWYPGCPVFWPVAYMPPEHARPGQAGKSDARADVYALGGMLFECLYDRPPNGARDQSPHAIVRELVARTGPPRPGVLSPRAVGGSALARRLEPVCLAALAASPTERPACAAAFRAEVERCAFG